MTLLSRFQTFINQHDLPLPGGQPALLAVSGGLDSVCLMRLFQDAGWPFFVAHVNFRLRGAESDEDERFVQQLAERAGAAFYVKRFETEAYARLNGLSIQMAARQLRYQWFEELRETVGAGVIVTAHHLNDSVETALINLSRGSGLRGLAGIRPYQEHLVRPLLFATREEIEAFAREKELAWREDSSNASDDYTRNFIRQHILPRFLELNPGFLHTTERSLEKFRGAADNLHFLLSALMSSPDGETYFIDKQQLAALPSPAEALRSLLKPFGFSAEQARQIAAHLPETGQEWTGNAGVRLFNERESLTITQAKTLRSAVRIEADDLMRTLPDGSKLVLTPALPAPPWPDGHSVALVDADQLRFPLLLRPWQPGDVFQPLGMEGRHQKIQDFFTNNKVARLDKEKAWVLADASGAVVWLLGWRPDERFKITSQTRKALKISWLNDQA